MDFFLLVLCLILAIALLRKTRAKEDSIRHSVERVKAQWVRVDMNEDETTPPSEPCEDAECKAVQDAENYVNLIWG
jgi:hypothetical protein